MKTKEKKKKKKEQLNSSYPQGAAGWKNEKDDSEKSNKRAADLRSHKRAVKQTGDQPSQEMRGPME
jgi:hypothetical protein